MGSVVNRQAINMVGRTRIRGVVELDDVTSVGRQSHVEEGVESEDVAALGQLGSRRRQDANRCIQAAIDSFGLEVQEQSLPLLALQRKTIDVGAGVQLAVDHRVDDDRRGLRGGVVRFDLDRFRSVAHDERARVTHAIGSECADRGVPAARPAWR